MNTVRHPSPLPTYTLKERGNLNLVYYDSATPLTYPLLPSPKQSSYMNTTPFANNHLMSLLFLECTRLLLEDTNTTAVRKTRR